MDISPPRPMRVLVVEDEIMVAMLIEDMLIDLGIEVVGPAMDARTAFHLAEVTELDFALLDINLGGETSFSTADVLRGRGVRFAFVTGYGIAGVRADLRGHPVIGKPIDPAALKHVLARPEPVH